ncbi:MAG: WD40 repeat domain-containing protein, partial [Dolichospermum sp.]
MSNFRNWFNEKSEEAKEQFLGEYPRLLLDGKKYPELFKLLSNYYFIEAKINHPLFGVQALIEDYDLLDDSKIRNDLRYVENVKALQLIKKSLFRKSHIISQDPKQLKGQLSAQLKHFELPEIKILLEQITTDENTGLYSLTGSLTPPGDGLIKTISGHIESVSAVTTSDGRTLISGSSDNTIKVWNLVTREEKFTLRGHSDWVNAIALTPDGKTVISGSSDNTIKIWNLQTREEQFTLEGHSDWIRAIALPPDGKTLISGSDDKTIKIWDLETGEEKLTFNGHIYSVNVIALTPDGKTVISGSRDTTIKIWDLETGEEKFTFKGHSDW